MRVAGIDGFTRGWIAVVLAERKYESAVTAVDFASLVAALGQVDAIAVDIPIGLPIAGHVREADGAARAMLKGRSGAIFSVPPRQVLEAEPYGEANAVSKRLNGRGITVYSYSLRKKILEVDDWLAANSGRDVREVHPEVSFVVLARALEQEAPRASKKSWRGFTERRALLEGAGLRLPADLGAAGEASVDDVIDAAVAAWSASRVSASEAACLPDPAPPDESGRMVAIWA